MKLKAKIITGFRKDQEHTIEADEVHKAYYLFLHPDERGIFNNGLAIKGSDIQSIVPDYNATMGWNKSHILDDDDWNEINRLGVDRKMRDLLCESKELAQLQPQEAKKLLEEKKLLK